MDIVKYLKFGFSMAVPASQDILDLIRVGTLVHKTKVKYLSRMIDGVYARPDGQAVYRIDMTGNFGMDPLALMRATLRDLRVVNFDVFQDATGKGFTSYTYFFLGEPDADQLGAQAYRDGDDGDVATIRISGADLLSDPRRSIFYRRGLFWEADKAVVVKGGYSGPAQISPAPANLKVPFI
ncbi:hypothetical protein [Novosphingobium resinovorum]|uniref:hypothetical protein n=1 Tax=Novosphingobium resinovorum TaxID=158500 RepID=UPI002ED1F338|nr:hypothetical protein [Novosphingobium resinovorum]